MNETSNGEKPSSTNGNGDQPPPRWLFSIIGLLIVIGLVYLALRPLWHPAAFPRLGAYELQVQFWVATACLLAAIALRYGIEQGETALASITPAKAHGLVEKKVRGATALEHLVALKDEPFRTARVASLLLLTLSIAASVLYMGPGIESAILRYLPGVEMRDAMGLGHLLAFLLSSIAMLVFGEILPRSTAAASPERTALRKAWLLLLTRSVLYLPSAIIVGISSAICGLLRVRPYTPTPVVTEEQLRSLLEVGTDEGDLEEEERHMLHSVFEFTDTIVREVMTPRIDMDTVSVDATAEELITTIGESGHSRIPIMRDTVDHIVGVIHAKDLIRYLQSGAEFTIEEIMRPVYMIPENKKLSELMSEFRAGRNQLAIVQDEYGGTAGLVTIEDVVEELVGEIVDEYDEEEPMWEELPDGRFVFDGRAHLDDVNERLGTEFESEEFDTIGGFVFGMIGHQPEQDEEARHESWLLRIHETDGRRVLKVLVEPLAEEMELEVGEEQGV